MTITFQPLRRRLAFIGLMLTAHAGVAILTAQGAAYDVVEKSITELQADMAAGRVTSAQLVDIYQRRMAA
jgi:hypothetical protein